LLKNLYALLYFTGLKLIVDIIPRTIGVIILGALGGGFGPTKAKLTL